MDFLGQYNLRKLIVNKILMNNKRIPDEIINMVPILGPLHVSLNTRETCFKKYHPFFNELYKSVLNKKRDLSKNPPPFRINYILYLAHSGWIKIRSEIIEIFQNSKNIGIRTLIDLLDNIIPAVLDIYISLFHNNHFDKYWAIIYFINGKKHVHILIHNSNQKWFSNLKPAWLNYHRNIKEALVHSYNIFKRLKKH